jgi:hypothetical protein
LTDRFGGPRQCPFVIKPSHLLGQWIQLRETEFFGGWRQLLGGIDERDQRSKV